MSVIDVAKTYSKAPFGRFRDDGEFSAERFRDDVLIPLLEHIQNDTENTEVVVDFTGVPLGIGSSFLEECFGGLVRAGFDPDFLKKHVKVRAKLDYYQTMVNGYIEKAKAANA